MKVPRQLRIFPNTLSLSMWAGAESRACVWGSEALSEREFFSQLANWGAEKPCLGGSLRRLLLLRLLNERGRTGADLARVEALVDELRGAAVSARQFREAADSCLYDGRLERLSFFFDLYADYETYCEAHPDLDRGLRRAIRRLGEGDVFPLITDVSQLSFAPLQRLSWQKTLALDALARAMAPRELHIEVPHWQGDTPTDTSNAQVQPRLAQEHPAQPASELLLARLEALGERATLSVMPRLLPSKLNVRSICAANPVEERAQVVATVKSAIASGRAAHRMVVLVPNASAVPAWEQAFVRAGVAVHTPQKRLAHTAWGGWLLRLFAVLAQNTPRRDAVLSLLENSLSQPLLGQREEGASALRRANYRGHAPMTWDEARACGDADAVHILANLSTEFRQPRTRDGWHLWLSEFCSRLAALDSTLTGADWLSALCGDDSVGAQALAEQALAVKGVRKLIDALSVRSPSASRSETESALIAPADLLFWLRSELSAAVLPRSRAARGVHLVTSSELPDLSVDLLVATGLVDDDFPGAVVEESLLSRVEREELARALIGKAKGARWLFDLAQRGGPAGQTVELARRLGALLAATEFADEALWTRPVADWEGRRLEPSRVWSAVTPEDVFDPDVGTGPPAPEGFALLRAEREAQRLSEMLNPEQAIDPRAASSIPRPSIRSQAPLRFSASSLEDVAACRFRYFCKHVLRARDEEDAAEDLDKRFVGKLAHAAFEKLVTVLIKTECVPFEPERAERAITICEESIDGVLSELDLGPAKERVYQETALLKRRLLSLVATLYDRGEGFVPEHLEQSFGFDEENSWPALRVQTDLGAAQIRGRIDLVEKRDGFVRVTDLKSGGASRLESKLGRKLGLQELQLSVYCAAAAEAYDTREVDGRLLSLRDGSSTKSLRKKHARRSKRSVDVDQRVLLEDEQGEATEFAEALRSLVRSVQRRDYRVYPADGACDFCKFAAACRFPRGAPTREEGTL